MLAGANQRDESPIEHLGVGGKRIRETRARLDRRDDGAQDDAKSRVFNIIDQILQSFQKRYSGAGHLGEVQTERDEIFRRGAGAPTAGHRDRPDVSFDQIQTNLCQARLDVRQVERFGLAAAYLARIAYRSVAIDGHKEFNAPRAR